MTTLYLGTDTPRWLTLAGPPLMVSRRRIHRDWRRTLQPAAVPWFLDSGGFTELSLYGAWSITAATYAADVARFRDQIGRMTYAAPQDWMVEPSMLARTGLDVETHQRLTIENLLDLRTIDPTLPVVPVLQGWTVADYQRHVDQYAAAGVDLTAEPLVGVGSVCRRQATAQAVTILRTLAARGLRLHAFGVKSQGLTRAWPYVESADSHAWSYRAWRDAQDHGSCGRLYRGRPVKSCNHCHHYAVAWWERARHASTRPIQEELWPDL